MIFGINENATDRVVTDGSGIVLVKSIMNELIAAFALLNFIQPESYLYPLLQSVFTARIIKDPAL